METSADIDQKVCEIEGKIQIFHLIFVPKQYSKVLGVNNQKALQNQHLKASADIEGFAEERSEKWFLLVQIALPEATSTTYQSHLLASSFLNNSQKPPL